MAGTTLRSFLCCFHSHRKKSVLKFTFVIISNLVLCFVTSLLTLKLVYI